MVFGAVQEAGSDDCAVENVVRLRRHQIVRVVLEAYVAGCVRHCDGGQATCCGGWKGGDDERAIPGTYERHPARCAAHVPCHHAGLTPGLCDQETMGDDLDSDGSLHLAWKTVRAGQVAAVVWEAVGEVPEMAILALQPSQMLP